MSLTGSPPMTIMMGVGVGALPACALGPSCVSPTSPQLKREWSLWSEFGSISTNLCDLSKGYFGTTFLSSSPICPARQSGLHQLTCERSPAGSHLHHRQTDVRLNFRLLACR